MLDLGETRPTVQREDVIDSRGGPRRFAAKMMCAPAWFTGNEPTLTRLMPFEASAEVIDNARKITLPLRVQP